MIIVRLGRGIQDHFSVRLSEWIMVWPAVGMWLALRLQPDMFSMSASFTALRHWGSENDWAFLCLVCGLSRLAALSVNGTFEAFRYSPHVRIAASLIGIFFWSQWTLGFLATLNDGIGAASAVVTYSTFCLAELGNVYRACSDVGAQSKAKREGRQGRR